MYIGGINNNYTIPINNVGRVAPGNNDDKVDGSSKANGSYECKTCQERMYVDGSNESDVSFKTPGHISPEQSYAKVLSHEQEHVANAIQKGNKPGAKLINATVSLRMATCPECGKNYVAGGLTKTTIKYTESNPYEKGRKIVEGRAVKGMNVDESV